MAPEIDVKAYFERINYTGSLEPTLETLSSINLHHTCSIPFENLNPLLGWPVNLDGASLQQKLVTSRRGGYCYEQNLLFKDVLEKLGFEVHGLAARVVWHAPEALVPARTHLLLRVNIENRPYIADVGFGGMTLTAPIRLEYGVEQPTPHEPFRLIRAGEEVMLEAKLAGEWQSLYKFTLEEQHQPDYEVGNWYVSCHPKSRFVNHLIAALAGKNRRYTLMDNEFTTRDLTGSAERRQLRTTEEIRAVLQDVFRLALPEAPVLDGALQRIIPINPTGSRLL